MADILKQPVYRLKRRWRDALTLGTKRAVEINAGGLSVVIRSSKPDQLIAGEAYEVHTGRGQDELLDRVTPPYRTADRAEMIRRGWLVEVPDEVSAGVPASVPVSAPTPAEDPAPESIVPDNDEHQPVASDDSEGGPVFPLPPGTPEDATHADQEDADEHPSPAMMAALESIHRITSGITSEAAPERTIDPDDAPAVAPDAAPDEPSEPIDPEPDSADQEPHAAPESPDEALDAPAPDEVPAQDEPAETDSGQKLSALPKRRVRKTGK